MGMFRGQGFKLPAKQEAKSEPQEDVGAVGFLASRGVLRENRRPWGQGWAAAGETYDLGGAANRSPALQNTGSPSLLLRNNLYHLKTCLHR